MAKLYFLFEIHRKKYFKQGFLFQPYFVINYISCSHDNEVALVAFRQLFQSITNHRDWLILFVYTGLTLNYSRLSLGRINVKKFRK